MNVAVLLKGVVAGLCIAAPVGPVGVLCMRRSLAEGVRVGFASGLGAATADATYGCVAAFGLTAISGFFLDHQFWTGLIGGILMCGFGVHTFVHRPAEVVAVLREDNLLAAYASTLLLTLANPSTILSFIAIFAGLGSATAGGYLAASLSVLGVFLGSACWWLILSTGVDLLRDRVNFGRMQAVNRFAGVALVGFGLYVLSKSLFR
jgi:threonine/homoserine/homoserine lactone efflux protein